MLAGSWLEHYTDNVEVGGSSPPAPTTLTVPAVALAKAGNVEVPSSNLGMPTRYEN